MAATYSNGFGPGRRKGTGRTKLVVRGDKVVEVESSIRKRSGTAGFVPFVSHQPTRKEAQELGLQRLEDTKATVFETAGQLQNFMAREKHFGRAASWKDH